MSLKSQVLVKMESKTNNFNKNKHFNRSHYERKQKTIITERLLEQDRVITIMMGR